MHGVLFLNHSDRKHQQQYRHIHVSTLYLLIVIRDSSGSYDSLLIMKARLSRIKTLVIDCICCD